MNDVSRAHILLVWVVISILASSAAILTRFADVPATSIGFWRVAGAAVVLLPWCIHTWRKEGMPRILTFGAIAAGAALGIHFATWCWSIQNTTIANAALFVGLQPLIVPFISRALIREKLTTGEYVGSFLALVGLVWIVSFQVTIAPDHLAGSLVALFSAAWCGLYLVLSRKYRSNHHIILFSWTVYVTAAIVQAIAAVILNGGIYVGDVNSQLALAGLVILPTVGGHTLAMYLLRHAKSQLLSLTVPAQFVLCTIAAMFIFGEFPAWSFYAGAVVILAGLFIGVHASR